MTSTILRLKDLISHTGLSRSAIYDRMDKKSLRYAADFPKSFPLGGRAVGWRKSEVDTWLEQCQITPESARSSKQVKPSPKSTSFKEVEEPKPGRKSRLSVVVPEISVSDISVSAAPAVSDVKSIAVDQLQQRNQQVNTSVCEVEAEVADWTKSLAFGLDNPPAFYSDHEMFTVRLRWDDSGQKIGTKRSFSAKTHGGVVYSLVLQDESKSNRDETFAWLRSFARMRC